jgi:hypothetical protein
MALAVTSNQLAALVMIKLHPQNSCQENIKYIQMHIVQNYESGILVPYVELNSRHLFFLQRVVDM